MKDTDKNVKEIIPKVELIRLEQEINALVDRIAGQVKAENEYLKKRIGVLQAENLKLCSMLYGGNNKAIKCLIKSGNGFLN